MTKTTNEIPKTIAQLEQWYISHNLPDEETSRFFIGKNYKRPKAFGIYKDKQSNNYIVYKNKSDGTRFVRYSGKDEAHAVNELYVKLKQHINDDYSKNTINANKNVKSKSTSKPLSNSRIIRKKRTQKNAENVKDLKALPNPKDLKHIESAIPEKSKKTKESLKIKKNHKRLLLIISICLVEILIFLAIIFILSSQPEDGYYLYNNNYYYCQNWNWYFFNADNDDWEKCNSIPKELKKQSSNYIFYNNIEYTDFTRFENTRYYKNNLQNKNWNMTSDVEEDFSDDI